MRCPLGVISNYNNNLHLEVISDDEPQKMYDHNTNLTKCQVVGYEMDPQNMWSALTWIFSQVRHEKKIYSG